MNSSTVKKALGILLQAAITFGALAYVFHDDKKRALMADALRGADWRWLAAALAVYGGVELLAVWRWRLLLHIQGFHLGWRKATGILFIGEFFLTFTPGLVGGDAMRIVCLARNEPKKKVDAVTAVLMDRIMGMLALISLAAVILTARYGWLSRSPAAGKLLGVVTVLLGLGAAALATALIAARAKAFDSPRVPAKIREMAVAFQQFARDRTRTAVAFATTLLSHGCYYTSFCCAAQAVSRLSQPAPAFWDVFSIMPIENTLTALPISLAGIGVRESLFQTLLYDLSGVPAAVGALVGAMGFCAKALWALPGAYFFLVDGLGKRSDVVKPESAPATPA